MLTVVAQTAYPPSAASARVRLAAFAPFLAEHGIDLDYRPTLTDAQYAALSHGRQAVLTARAVVASAVALARRPDGLLLVHRLRALLPVPGLEFSPRIDAYDFDDAMYERSGSQTVWARRVLKAEARRWARYVAAARLVVAGNAELASAARERSGRVEVIPSCVDPSRYVLRGHRDRSPVTVGWLGSRTTSPFLARVVPAFERLNRDRLRARLIVVGAGSLPTARWLEQRPWSIEREAADLREFDIGIMPMP
ncbi:MAG TPA: hypothetical protein VGI50_16400, partial [Solirubrobacteraceae bacterium]